MVSQDIKIFFVKGWNTQPLNILPLEFMIQWQSRLGIFKVCTVADLRAKKLFLHR